MNPSVWKSFCKPFEIDKAAAPPLAYARSTRRQTWEGGNAMKKLMLMILLSLAAYGQGYKTPTEKQERPTRLVTNSVTKSISIGRWLYAGTDSNGVSIYKAIYTQPKLISTPININNATFFVKNTQASTGAFKTPLTWVGFSDPSGLASCATECIAIELQTQLSPDNSPVTFTLTDGEQFTTYGITTVVLKPNNGQTSLVPNQFVGIVLTATK
jgi:hypothetical protein